MAKVIVTILAVLLVSCSGISTLKKADRTKLYSSEFLEKVTFVTNLIDQKKIVEAEKELAKLDENELSTTEISLKRYLLGRFYLSVDNTEKAIFNFELALAGSAGRQYFNFASIFRLINRIFSIGDI